MAAGFLCALPVCVWAQSVTATLPVAGSALATNRATNRIYVASSSGIVTVIDGATQSTTTLQVGGQGPAVAVNEATNKIYVADAISGDVTVIDGATNALATVVDPNAKASRSLAVNSITNKIYVVKDVTLIKDLIDTNVTVIDGATNSTTTVSVPNNAGKPIQVAVNPTKDQIYVLNIKSGVIRGRLTCIGGNVMVVDGASNAATTVIDLPAWACPQGVAVNPISNTIFVATYNYNVIPSTASAVAVIDGITNAVTTVRDPNARGSAAIAVNSATDKIYVANERSNNVTVIDGTTLATITVTDPNAIRPGAVAVDEATNIVYVVNGGTGTCDGPHCNTNTGSVTLVNGATNATTTLIDLAAIGPDAVAVNPLTDRIYVANGMSGNLTVIGGDVVPTSHALAVILINPFPAGDGTVTSGPSGIDCGASCGASFAAGTIVDLTAASAAGTPFVGWSAPCSGNGSCKVTMNADQYVTATFGVVGGVPNVVGLTQAAATNAIYGAGLAVGAVTQQSGNGVPSGNVIGESPPAGTNVASGSAVDLVVSDNVAVPVVSTGSASGGGGAMDWLTLGLLVAYLYRVFARVRPHRVTEALAAQIDA